MLATSERPIALAPALGEAHAAKGLALYVLGRYDEALDPLRPHKRFAALVSAAASTTAAPTH